MCPVVTSGGSDLGGDSVVNDDDQPEERQRDHEGEGSLIMSLHEVIQPAPDPSPPPDRQPQSDNLSNPLLEHISSPIGSQLFDFCDAEIFYEALQNPEVTSNPNISFHPEITNLLNNNNNNSNNNQNGAADFVFEPTDDIDNDISVSINFSTAYDFSNNFTTTHQEHHHDHNYQLPLNSGPHQYHAAAMGAHHATLSTVFEEDRKCLSQFPPFLTVLASNSSSSSCSFPDGSFLPGNLQQALGADNSCIFTGNLLSSSELQGKELDYNGDNGGIFCSDHLPLVFNSRDIQQVLSNESSQLVSGATSSGALTTEISSEDSNIKVGKLSAEQRKEKIHRYLKKRTERNFSKKIKYACRKTLADSRPRVRGRFAKNDDFGETNSHRHSSLHLHEDDDYDEVQVKEEDDMVDSSDIFTQFTAVNSFKCNNYQLQSWI